MRRALLLALLLAEGLTLGVCFDSKTVEGLPRGWWSPVLGVSGWLMTAALTVLAALLLVVSARLRREGAAAASTPRRAGVLVVLHLGCFAALFALSATLFRADATPGHPGALVSAWLMAVALTLATWLGALAPARELIGALRGHAPVLGLACALGLCAFGVGKLSQAMWEPLRGATFVVAGALLRACGQTVVEDPPTYTLGVRDFSVQIAPECSGYEGVGLAWVFLLAALWLFRDRLRFPRAYLLLAIGTLAALLANAVRLAALVLVGAFVSTEVALGGFHSYSGTLLFSGTVLALVALALRSPWFARVEERGARATYPAAPYLAPFLTLVAAGLCARAVAADDVDPLFFAPPLAGLAACAWFAGDYRRMSWRCSWFAVPAGILAAAVWTALDALLRGASAEPVPAPAALQLATRLGGTLLIVPFVEELAFRGFLARRLSNADFERMPPERISLAGVLVSALAFGLLHRLVVAGVLSGIVYALVYRRRGRLADAVVAHATTNAALVVVALATDRWELWM